MPESDAGALVVAGRAAALMGIFQEMDPRTAAGMEKWGKWNSLGDKPHPRKRAPGAVAPVCPWRYWGLLLLRGEGASLGRKTAGARPLFEAGQGSPPACADAKRL